MLTARLLRCFKNFGILVYRLVSKIFLCRVTTSMQKKLSLPIIRMEKGLKMTSSSFTAVIHDLFDHQPFLLSALADSIHIRLGCPPFCLFPFQRDSAPRRYDQLFVSRVLPKIYFTDAQSEERAFRARQRSAIFNIPKALTQHNKRQLPPPEDTTGCCLVWAKSQKTTTLWCVRHLPGIALLTPSKVMASYDRGQIGRVMESYVDYAVYGAAREDFRAPRPAWAIRNSCKFACPSAFDAIIKHVSPTKKNRMVWFHKTCDVALSRIVRQNKDEGRSTVRLINRSRGLPYVDRDYLLDLLRVVVSCAMVYFEDPKYHLLSFPHMLVRIELAARVESRVARAIAKRV